MIHYGGFIYILFQITADADLELSGVSKMKIIHKYTFAGWPARLTRWYTYFVIDLLNFGWMVDLWMCTFWFPKSFDRLKSINSGGTMGRRNDRPGVWWSNVYYDRLGIIRWNSDLAYQTVKLLKKIEAISPIVYNDGYLHKKVRGKTSSLVALYHYMCLYTRNSWEMEAIFNTDLFQETEHWNSNLPTWLCYFGYQPTHCFFPIMNIPKKGTF